MAVALTAASAVTKSPSAQAETNGLFIYSTKACLRGKTPPGLGHLALASEVAGRHTYLTILKGALSANSKMVRTMSHRKTRSYCH
jgi:hypothetical protein